MSDSIPFLDLPRQHQALLPALSEMLLDHVKRAAFIGGESVSQFEASFARYCGVQGCVGVANGTDSLALSLKALGVGAGDVVLVPAHTFIATAEAVTMVGATPRFVDSEPVSYNIDPQALRTVDGAGVKAVMPVHLYGQPADMAPINAIAKERGWKVLEDCAQAHGAHYQGKPVGSLGSLGSFSFYPGKNLGALGDGGAVVGNDDALLARIRRVANHGRKSQTEHDEPGINSRLDAIQAAALSIKLTHLNDWNAARARVAGWYNERLANVAGLQTPQLAADRTHVYHLYVVLVGERDRLRAELQKDNIASGLHYPGPLHLQPAYRQPGLDKGAFPVAERVANECASLPMFPELTEAQVDRVAKAVTAFVKAGA